MEDNGRRKVLLVDDEETVREVLAEILSAHGYAVDAVAEGVSALDKMRTTGYDLLILDVNIPGLDGIELCRRALDEHPGLDGRILFISGDTGGELEAVQVFVGSHGEMLSKPFVKEKFLDVVARLAGPGGSGGPEGGSAAEE